MRSLAIPIVAALSFAIAGPAPSRPALDLSPRAVDRPQAYVSLRSPAWSRNAVIYELNIRQFTQAGTIVAAAEQLTRLKRLGVDIIWLMPLYPIGERNRLGSLGSPYSVRDYLHVDPQLGTMADLRAFVDAAHRQGMHVILDWVANHSAWDNPLTVQHPDWYEHDRSGSFRSPTWYDWSDVIDFDYDQPALRRYMTEALKFWLREADVDGFRADMADAVPLQFWENARAELDAIRPVFMLAEAEQPELHRRAFDATYAWKLAGAMRAVAAGSADVGALKAAFAWYDNAWPPQADKLAYTSNHDTNAFEGTDRELFGPALPAMTALTFAADTMPLLYNGQELGNTRRLKPFERDPLRVQDLAPGDFYARLIAWKHANPALANAGYGGRMVEVRNSVPDRVLSFVRTSGANKVLAVFNFSALPRHVAFADDLPNGDYTDFAGGMVTVTLGTTFDMPPWSFRLLANTARSPGR